MFNIQAQKRLDNFLRKRGERMSKDVSRAAL